MTAVGQVALAVIAFPGQAPTNYGELDAFLTCARINTVWLYPNRQAHVIEPLVNSGRNVGLMLPRSPGAWLDAWAEYFALAAYATHGDEPNRDTHHGRRVDPRKYYADGTIILNKLLASGFRGVFTTGGMAGTPTLLGKYRLHIDPEYAVALRALEDEFGDVWDAYAVNSGSSRGVRAIKEIARKRVIGIGGLLAENRTVDSVITHWLGVNWPYQLRRARRAGLDLTGIWCWRSYPGLAGEPDDHWGLVRQVDHQLTMSGRAFLRARGRW